MTRWGVLGLVLSALSLASNRGRRSRPGGS
jgi:hypothetical protein